MFVHGGFNRHFYLDDKIYNGDDILMWDRDLWFAALSYKQIVDTTIIKKGKFKMQDSFKEIFIGHTTTMNWGTTEPMNACNIWNLDTGAGGTKGKLTIMNVDTKEYFQSDETGSLYPELKGRW